MLDNTCLKKDKKKEEKKKKEQKKKNYWAPSIHENAFPVNGFSFPNAVWVMAVKKETELSDLK